MVPNAHIYRPVNDIFSKQTIYRVAFLRILCALARITDARKMKQQKAFAPTIRGSHQALKHPLTGLIIEKVHNSEVEVLVDKCRFGYVNTKNSIPRAAKAGNQFGADITRCTRYKNIFRRVT